jgi:hypothetical protein
VVSFTLQSVCPRSKRPRYPVGRRLGEPQSLSGCRDEEKNSQSSKLAEFREKINVVNVLLLMASSGSVRLKSKMSSFTR